MTPFVSDPDFQLYLGDVREVLRELPAESVDCALTSPPFYALRDYGVDRQIGLEETPEQWADELVGVFREVRRLLKPQGTLWVECGDSYSAGGLGPGGSEKQASNVGANLSERKKPPPGFKAKDLLGTPWLLAFALRADGWWLRQAIIWHKPNAMPESATDRCTTAHSYVFLLSKQARYHFDAEAIAEPAEWARWGDQTVPKYEGTDTASGWMQPKTRKEIALLTRGPGGNRHDAPDDGFVKGGGWAGGPQRADGKKNPRSVWTIPTQGFSARALGGDAPRTTSPDCPVHGDRSALAPTAPDGEREGTPAIRTGRTDGRHAQEPLGGSAPTDPSRAPDSDPDSSDSTVPERVRVASSRSSESRKTARDPATTQPCTPSAESSGRTADTSASPASSEPHPGTPSSTSSEASDAREPDSASAQTTSRNVGRCTCKPSITDHFATWPEALCERIIKAGCPEGGTCLDPFMGSGTTALVARKLGRKSIGVELNPDYAALAAKRLSQLSLLSMEGVA